MSIIGKNGEAWKAVEKLPSGHPSALVSFDVMRAVEKSEYYDAIMVEVKFTMGDWWNVVEDKMMPKPDLMNKICEARGIEGTDAGETKQLVQLIDINRLHCKFDDEKFVNRPVGYSCTKFGAVMKEDGSMRTSLPCTREYNVWERLCARKFGPEEEATNYYDPKIVQAAQNGNKFVNCPKRGGGTYRRWLKFDTRAKRQKAFDEEMLFAAAKADTKARNLVIRNLAGMDLGYTESVLRGMLDKNGVGTLYFHRIQESPTTQKAKIGAKLKSLMGETIPAFDSVFGEEEPEPRDVTPQQASEPESTDFDDYAPPEMRPADVLAAYKDRNMIPQEDAETVDKMISYMNNADTSVPAYKDAQSRVVEKIAKIESGLNDSQKMTYTLKEV